MGWIAGAGAKGDGAGQQACSRADLNRGSVHEGVQIGGGIAVDHLPQGFGIAQIVVVAGQDPPCHLCRLAHGGQGLPQHGGRVALDEFRFRAGAGGVFTLRNARLDRADHGMDLEIAVDRLPLGTWFDLLGKNEVAGTGLLEGSLRLRVDWSPPMSVERSPPVSVERAPPVSVE